MAQTRCVKIKLAEGSRPRVEEWAAELNRRADEVISTLAAENVSLEAAFLDTQADGDYLIYVMRAEDFTHAAATAKTSTADIDAYHQAFKKAYWQTRTQLPILIDFTVGKL